MTAIHSPERAHVGLVGAETNVRNGPFRPENEVPRKQVFCPKRPLSRGKWVQRPTGQKLFLEPEWIVSSVFFTTPNGNVFGSKAATKRPKRSGLSLSGSKKRVKFHFFAQNRPKRKNTVLRALDLEPEWTVSNTIHSLTGRDLGLMNRRKNVRNRPLRLEISGVIRGEPTVPLRG